MNFPELLPLRRALGFILLATLLVSGSVAGVLIYWKHYKYNLQFDDRYTIEAIVQSCSDASPLPTDYLAELLGLSIDQPVNLYKFNTREAVSKLRASPLIKSPEIQKIIPGMIHVKYKLRKLIAYAGEYSNGGIDNEGLLIPVKPFYSRSNIPEYIFGESETPSWGFQFNQDKFLLARQVQEAIDRIGIGSQAAIRRIDVAKAFSKNFGQREIVVVIEEFAAGKQEGRDRSLLITLRLAKDNWLEQLASYHQIKQKIQKDFASTYEASVSYIVDMRISQLAFMARFL